MSPIKDWLQTDRHVGNKHAPLASNYSQTMIDRLNSQYHERVEQKIDFKFRKVSISCLVIGAIIIYTLFIHSVISMTRLNS